VGKKGENQPSEPINGIWALKSLWFCDESIVIFRHIQKNQSFPNFYRKDVIIFDIGRQFKKICSNHVDAVNLDKSEKVNLKNY
jgi:hypothetical protein